VKLADFGMAKHVSSKLPIVLCYSLLHTKLSISQYP